MPHFDETCELLKLDDQRSVWSRDTWWPPEQILAIAGPNPVSIYGSCVKLTKVQVVQLRDFLNEYVKEME